MAACEREDWSECDSAEWADLCSFADFEPSSTDEECLDKADDHAAQQCLDKTDDHAAQIECRTDQVSHAEFAERFRHKRPVLLRGLAAGWRAQTEWATASHLGALLDAEVLVLRAPDNRRFLKRDCVQEQQPFSAVAEELFAPGQMPAAGQRLYARAPLARGLRADVELDALEQLVGGAPRESFREPNCGVWLGSAGCVTPLHYDLCHGFLVGVLGTKHVTYFCPDDFGALYPRPEQPELSTVDLDAWRQGKASAAGRAEREAHPLFGEATAWHATLRPGDVLYTPPYWWHHVETTAEAAALSVLVPLDPRPDEPVHACHFR